MKKKRICIDINSALVLPGRSHLSGVGRTTLELVRALASMKDELPFELVLYTQNMKGIKGAEYQLPFAHKHIYLRNTPAWNKCLAGLRLKEWFVGYDLLHIPHNFDYVANPAQTILTLHDALFMKMQEKAFNHEDMKRKVPSLARKVKALITCSEYSKKDIMETMGIPAEKIHVVPWGCNRQVFYRKEDKYETRALIKARFGLSKPYFLSVSCNAERKNTPAIINNYIALLHSNNKIINDLCLVWDAPKPIREKVNQSGYGSRIHFLPPVSDKYLCLLYNGATATVFLSLYEGFGLPVLESMACGTPVLCSGLSSLPEVGGDAPIYVEPFDNEQIRSAMLAFDRQEVDRMYMIKKGLRQAGRFSWERCARETAKIYNQYQ